MYISIVAVLKVVKTIKQRSKGVLAWRSSLETDDDEISKCWRTFPPHIEVWKLSFCARMTDVA